MKFVILLITLCSISHIIASNQSIQLKIEERRRSACKIAARLKCNIGSRKRFTYYVYHEQGWIDIEGCKGVLKTDAQWALISNITYKTAFSGRKGTQSNERERSIVLPARIAPAGHYSLQLTVTELSTGFKSFVQCGLIFESEPPVIIFKQGLLQYVQIGSEYTVDATISKFHGEPVLPIRWTLFCRVDKNKQNLPECQGMNTSCQKSVEMKGYKFSGIFHKCLDDMTFLGVIQLKDGQISAKHVVAPRKFFGCLAEIICEKNCDREGSHRSNPAISIVMTVIKKNDKCEGFDEWRPKWIIEGIHRKNMEITNNNKRLIIKGDILNFGVSFAVLATVDNKFEAWIRVRTTLLIKGPNCYIIPKSGISLQTEFALTCSAEDPHLKVYGPYYNIYQMVNGKKRLVAGVADEHIPLILSSIKGQPSQRLIIEGRDIFHNAFNCTVNPITVSELKLNEATIDKLLNKIEHLTSEDSILGPEYAAGLLNELNQQDLDEGLKKISKAKIMSILSKVKIIAMDTYDQLASITAVFTEEKDMDMNYKTNLGNLCKHMASVHLQKLYNNVYAKYHEMAVKQQAQLNADCAAKLLEEAKELRATLTTTTERNVESVVTEDYPDYGGQPETSSDDKNIDTITDSAKAIATSLAPSESREMITNQSITLVAVEEGNYMGDARFEIGSVAVVPSSEFKEHGKDLITAIINNYDKDLLSHESELAADIVDISFFKNATQLKGTKYDLQFSLTKEIPSYDLYTVKIPYVGDGFLEIDRIMNVHRLNLFAFESCVIKFSMWDEVNLKVGLSVNQRPREEHFNAPTGFVVKGLDTNSWTIEEPFGKRDQDSFMYVAVIPHPDMSQKYGGDMAPYQIQFSQVSCVSYNRLTYKWSATETCDAKLTGVDENTTVHCICTTTSLHSVYFDIVPNRLDEQMEIEIVIEYSVNYVIFIHTLIVFLCYAIALALILKRQPRVFGRDKLFFLSDNLKNDRFCYMLIIRTGTYAHSGTTANIMVQVFGAKCKSRPHVLNYPDPACKLLQRDNVDWLVMAHGEHLGDLQSILLWTDGIGLYPAWYCQDILIYDLQKNKSYQFNVNVWLSPLEKHLHYTRIDVSPYDGAKAQKEKLELVKHLRFHYLGRHTWNIFVKYDDDLTYPERLTVILSMIYTTYACVIILLGSPRLTKMDAFGYGEFQFYTEIVTYSLASSIISSAIHLLIVYFFRNSKRTDISSTLVVTIKRFSFKMRKFLWYLLIIWIVICLMYLLIFGFWVPYNSVSLWMIITFISLLISIIIWENLFIIMVDIVTSRVGYVEQAVYRFDVIIVEIERQRKILFKKFGEVLLRPYFRKHYRLLTPDELFDLRKIMATRIEVASLFKDMCLFLVYILVLYLICFVQYDSTINHSNKMMHLMVEESIYADRLYLLKNIQKIEDVYDYLKFVIIPTVHATNWYGNWYASEAGQLADFSTKILGVVQLRQQRRTQKCAVPYELRGLQIPCTNEAPVFNNWEFNNGSDITSTIGHLKIYDGSGYIAYLGRNLRNSRMILQVLRANKWIDINTAVLFIDFLTYNANLNMFNAVRIVIERSPSGRYTKLCTIFTSSFIYTELFYEIFVALLLALLVIIIIIMVLKRLVQILVYKGKYFNSFWNILDVVLTCLSITLIVLFFVRKKYINDLLKSIVETDHNKFVNYYHLITISEATTIVYGLTLSIATLRLWKFLHFGVLFRVMERTILKAGPHLFGMFFYQVVVYLMMVSFIYPMYGENLHEFRDYYTSLVTLYLASINFTEHLPHIYPGKDNSFLYLVYSFYLIVSVCFMNFYATILILNLEESRVYYSNAKHYYTIHTYVKDIFYFYKEKWRQHLKVTRLKGGAEEDQEMYQLDADKLVYPKAQEHRYADPIMMSKAKMNLMKNIAILSVKNMNAYGGHKQLTESDYNLMANIVVDIIKSRNELNNRFAHIFFKGWEPNTGKFKFVPDTRILQMEMVLKRLLQDKMQEVVIKEDPKDITDFVIHETGNAERLEYMRKCLELIHDIISNITVVDDKRKILELRKQVEKALQAHTEIDTDHIKTDDEEPNEPDESNL